MRLENNKAAKVALPRSEFLPLSALHPSPNNARTHSKRQIEQIARSIERFGFTNPILIDGNRQILAGHGRVAAARQLGLKVVPTFRLDHLSDAEKRAYVLADNKIAEKAGWDRQLLAIELQALIDLDFDVSLTGFETAELDFIFEEAAEATGENPPEDVIPAYRENANVSQPGDLWTLGKHRLICGDARHEESFKLVVGDDRANFVFTDPPYNVPIDGHVCGLGRIRHQNFTMGCGEMTSAQFTSLLRTVFSNMVAFSTSGSIHQVCMDWRHIDEMLAAGRSVFSELKNVCVWNKSNAGMGSFYRSKHELIFVWKHGRAAHINNFELGQHGRHRSNVWDYAGANTFASNRLVDLASHPTVKPEALVADAIKDCSPRNGIVLDPFAGSGTTVIAAERTGRRARAIEIDPHYCDLVIRRWQTYAGKNAIHAQSNRSFGTLEHTALKSLDRGRAAR